MSVEISPPFRVFTDVDGEPLEDGYIYVGAVNQNPQAVPVSVFWDFALTIPAAQPIRTLGGYPSRSGTPSRMYIAESGYSISVLNKNSTLIYSDLDNRAGDAGLRQDLANDTDPAKGAGLVGFIQAGTGAAGRTLLSKARETISVLDFDDTAGTGGDDTAAIQECADHVASIGGGVIWFPSGRTYRKSATLNITSSDTEILMGSGSVLIDTANGYTSIQYAAGLSNIKGEGLKLIGMTDDTAGSFGYAIFTMENCTNVRFKDCVLSGYTGGIACLINNRDVSIKGCRFANMTFIPAMASGGYGILSESNSAFRISDNYFATTVERHHIYVGRNVADLATLSTDFTISGNTFESLSLASYATGTEFACKIMATQDVTITGNTFRGGCGHVWLTDTAALGHANPYPSSVVVSSNTFVGVLKGDSINAGCVVSTASYAFDVTVSDNKMNSNDTIAHVYFSRGEDIKVHGNTIYAPIAGHGIASAGEVERMHVENNKIEVPAGSRGIALNLTVAANSPGFVARNNWINGGAIGIYVRESTDAVIADNVIRNTTQSSILFLSGTFTGDVRNNICETGVVGITFPATFVDFMWVYGNRFSGMSSKNIDHAGTGWMVEPIGNHKSNTVLQRKRAYNFANAAPTTGAWLVGDIVDANAPAAAGFIGFVCTVAGTPGTWKGYGAVAA